MHMPEQDCKPTHRGYREGLETSHSAACLGSVLPGFTHVVESQHPLGSSEKACRLVPSFGSV